MSVLVPVRNGAQTLAVCLEALARQTRPWDELIVVDNDSRDRTKDIITAFAGQHENVRYVFAPHPGRGQARNAGLRQASGDIIAMTDADCVVPEDWLERLCRPIIEEGETAVLGFEEDAIGNYWTRQRQADDRRFVQSKIRGAYIDHIDTKNFAIRTDIMKGLEFDPGLITYEDWDLFLRLRQSGRRIRFLPELLVRHQHDASFRELAVTQFVRGWSVQQVIDRHRTDDGLRRRLVEDESGRSLSLRNFLLFLPWAAWQCLTQPAAAPYRLTADLAWKLGGLGVMIDKKIRPTRRAGRD